MSPILFNLFCVYVRTVFIRARVASPMCTYATHATHATLAHATHATLAYPWGIIAHATHATGQQGNRVMGIPELFLIYCGQWAMGRVGFIQYPLFSFYPWSYYVSNPIGLEFSAFIAYWLLLGSMGKISMQPLRRV